MALRVVNVRLYLKKKKSGIILRSSYYYLYYIYLKRDNNNMNYNEVCINWYLVCYSSSESSASGRKRHSASGLIRMDRRSLTSRLNWPCIKLPTEWESTSLSATGEKLQLRITGLKRSKTFGIVLLSNLLSRKRWILVPKVTVLNSKMDTGSLNLRKGENPLKISRLGMYPFLRSR